MFGFHLLLSLPKMNAQDLVCGENIISLYRNEREREREAGTSPSSRRRRRLGAPQCLSIFQATDSEESEPSGEFFNL